MGDGRITLADTAVPTLTSVDVHPDGRHLLTADAEDGAVSTWDLVDGTRIRRFDVGEGLLSAAYDGSGQDLVVALADGIRLIDGRTGATIRAVEGSTAAVAKDGTVAVGEDHGTVVLWDGSLEHERARIGPSASAIQSITWSLDGTHLGLVHEDGIEVWDASTGARLLSVAGATSVALSPDGAQAVIGSDDAVAVWNVATAERRAELPISGERIVAAYSPDGSTLALGHFLGNVELWDSSAWDGSRADVVTRACQVAGRNLTPAEWTAHLADEPYRETCPDR